MKKLLLVLVIVLVGVGWWQFKGIKTIPLLSPWSGILGTSEEKKNDLKVIGFLPSWMVGKTRNYQSEVDELIFLGIGTDEEGNLVWDSQANKVRSESYLNIKERIKNRGGKNTLGIKLFEDEKIDKLLSSNKARQKLIEQIIVARREGNFGGVNIDFEYQGNQTGALEDEYMSFLGELKAKTGGEVSVDVYANTINKGGEEELRKLTEIVDNVIIMAYDYHRPGSDYAGPVAPIEAEPGNRYILETIKRIVDLGLNKDKFTVAIPLYGYEWKTVSEDLGAKVKRGWYQMASFKRANELEKDPEFKIYDLRFMNKTDKELIENKDIQEKEMRLYWDELSQSPWMVFKEDGAIHQIYYENERSLRAKLDLLKQSQIKNVGFWALGYEGESGEVWKIVRE